VRNQASCHEDMEVQLHTILSSAVDGGEWSVSPPTPLNPYKMSLETHFMGTRATPDVVKEREVSDNSRGSNLDSSFVQPDRVDRAHFIGEVREVRVGPGDWDGRWK